MERIVVILLLFYASELSSQNEDAFILQIRKDFSAINQQLTPDRAFVFECIAVNTFEKPEDYDMLALLKHPRIFDISDNC